jgi:hypothetical protein
VIAGKTRYQQASLRYRDIVGLDGLESRRGFGGEMGTERGDVQETRGEFM